MGRWEEVEEGWGSVDEDRSREKYFGCTGQL